MVKPGGILGLRHRRSFAEILDVLADRRLVGNRQEPPQARLVLLPVAERGFSFKDKSGVAL